jgi:spiro-SPASM protein
MKNIALINAIGAGEIASRPVMDGKSSIERAVETGGAMPGVDKVTVLGSPGQPTAGATLDGRREWTVNGLLSAIRRHAEGYEDVFYLFADCPLMDARLAARMHANHRKYFADYTFADGYPYGLAPEILRAETAERLQALSEKGAVPGRGAGTPSVNPAARRGTLFDLIKTDINSFDLETELAPRDQRLLRVSLTADSERNFLLLKRLMEMGARDAASVTALLEERPWILRTLPAFFPIQIVERCPQACGYCPYPKTAGDILAKKGFMPVESFGGIVDAISGFCGDAVLDVSLWGEPGLHPFILDIVKTALDKPGMELVIETSGVGWDQSLFRRIKEEAKRAPTWILSLDASSEEVYKGMRGEGFAESRRTAELLLELFGDSVHVQAVRMKENEDDLETFYRTWREKTPGVIVQKYDDFCGFLPQRKVTDLSPLRRFPCWHVMRDCPILLDGTVPMCREDLGKSRVLGNVLKEGFEPVWWKGEEIHRRHIEGRYPEICASCDEWYTYNF